MRKNKKLASTLLAMMALLGGKSSSKTLANNQNDKTTQNLKIENTKSKYTTAQKVFGTAISLGMIGIGIGGLIYLEHNEDKKAEKYHEDALLKNYPYAKDVVKFGYFKDLKEFEKYIKNKDNCHKDVKYALEHRVSLEEAKRIRKEEESKLSQDYVSEMANSLWKKNKCEGLAKKFGMDFDEFMKKYGEIIKNSPDSGSMELAIKFKHTRETNKEKFQKKVNEFNNNVLTKIVDILNKELESNEKLELDIQNDKVKSIENLIINQLHEKDKLKKENLLYGFKILVEAYDDFMIEKQTENKFVIKAKNAKFKSERAYSVELNGEQVILKWRASNP